MNERLFLPLSKEPYRDFASNGKRVEVRKYGRNFTERTVFSGRRIELRLGYSGGERLRGNIGEVVIGSLEEIFQYFQLQEVEPRAVDIATAIAENMNLLGKSEQYIGFSVSLDQL